MAKLFACQTFRDTTAMAQQVFGGVGFTLEYDVQLYFRRAKQLQISWWNDRELEERIAVISTPNRHACHRLSLRPAPATPPVTQGPGRVHPWMYAARHARIRPWADDGEGLHVYRRGR